MRILPSALCASNAVKLLVKMGNWLTGLILRRFAAGMWPPELPGTPGYHVATGLMRCIAGVDGYILAVYAHLDRSCDVSPLSPTLMVFSPMTNKTPLKSTSFCLTRSFVTSIKSTRLRFTSHRP